MYKNKRILCVIPARGGSKRLPWKNIKPLLGKPLIAYAIGAAKSSAYIDRVVVSTDAPEIADVAKKYGAEVPFLRPAKLATSKAPTLPVLVHALTVVEEKEKPFDYIVLIQPTVPGIRSNDIDAAIRKLAASGAQSCITICEIFDRPEFMFRLKGKGMLEPYSNRSYAGRTQDMEPLYRINGAVYVTQRATLMKRGMIVDTKSCAAVMMPRMRSTDIDTEFDLAVAELALKQ